MKNFAINLEKRMLKTFADNEKFNDNHPIQAMVENTQVCAIALQELEKEYERFKRNRTIKDEILYYKECYPIIAKWHIFNSYMIELEREIFISHDKLKIKIYKNCIKKLSIDFKKKQNNIIYYYKMIQVKI